MNDDDLPPDYTEPEPNLALGAVLFIIFLAIAFVGVDFFVGAFL